MEQDNVAVQLVVALGAYCPKVKIHNPVMFDVERQRAKRRTRPLTGRGNYGKNLMAHFDEKRFNEMKK
jgi:hypothetical protein